MENFVENRSQHALISFVNELIRNKHHLPQPKHIHLVMILEKKEAGIHLNKKIQVLNQLKPEKFDN